VQEELTQREKALVVNDDERKEQRREAVTAADDTGMVAGEELITEAETLLPAADLHAALPNEHPAHATIDSLHTEMQAQKPDVHAIRKHVGTLRTLPELEAIVANWWDDPRTQRLIGDIGRIGL
jgi:histidine ammonia-lyase